MMTNSICEPELKETCMLTGRRLCMGSCCWPRCRTNRRTFARCVAAPTFPTSSAGARPYVYLVCEAAPTADGQQGSCSGCAVSTERCCPVAGASSPESSLSCDECVNGRVVAPCCVHSQQLCCGVQALYGWLCSRDCGRLQTYSMLIIGTSGGAVPANRVGSYTSNHHVTGILPDLFQPA